MKNAKEKLGFCLICILTKNTQHIKHQIATYVLSRSLS